MHSLSAARRHLLPALFLLATAALAAYLPGQVEITVSLRDTIFEPGQEIPLRLTLRNAELEKIVLPNLNPDYLVYQAAHHGVVCFQLRRGIRGALPLVEPFNRFQPEFRDEPPPVVLYRGQSVSVEIDLGKVFRFDRPREKDEEYSVQAVLGHGDERLMSRAVSFRIVPRPESKDDLRVKEAWRGDASPEQLVERLLRAAKNEDWKSYRTCFDLVRVMQSSFPEQWTKYQESGNREKVLTAFADQLSRFDEFGRLTSYGPIDVQPVKKSELVLARVNVVYKRLLGAATQVFPFRYTFELTYDPPAARWLVTKYTAEVARPGREAPAPAAHGGGHGSGAAAAGHH